MYLSRRDPATGRVKKIYLGRGPKAEAAAETLAARRKQRAVDRRAVEIAESQVRVADDLTTALDEAAALLLEAVLLVAGFHRVNYGPWRKRRGNRDHGGRPAGANDGFGTITQERGTNMTTDGNGEQESAPEVLARIKETVDRAKGGNVALLQRLRGLLDSHPDFVRHYGDLARRAERAWIALSAGNDVYFEETLARSAESQRAELTRPGAQPIEKLLVEQVVSCGLQMNWA